MTAFALGTLARVAEAETSTTSPSPRLLLDWDAPSDCPTGAQVLADANTLAKNQSPASTDKPIVVRARVARVSEGQWRLILAVGPSERQLEAASCAQLARAAALFLALVLSPSTASLDDALPLGEPAPVEAVAPASGPSRATSPGHDKGESTPSRPRDPIRWHILAESGLAVDMGTLPHPEPLGFLAVGLRHGAYALLVEGAAGPEQQTTVDGSAGVALHPLSLALRPCWEPIPVGHVRFGPCLRTEVGWMDAHGIGVVRARTTDSPWLALGGDVNGWLTLGPHLEVRLGGGVVVPVIRPNFEVTSLGSVFQVAVAARIAAALVARF